MTDIVQQVFPATKQKTFAICPHCGQGESAIDHLIETRQSSGGSWQCDSCGMHYKVNVDKDGIVTVEKTNEKQSTIMYSLLTLPPQEKPVYFVIKQETYGREQTHENNEYYFNSHSCPTNWLKQIHKLVFENDDDPHGLLEFQRFIHAKDAIYEGNDVCVGDLSRTNHAQIDPFKTFPEITGIINLEVVEEVPANSGSGIPLDHYLKLTKG